VGGGEGSDTTTRPPMESKNPDQSLPRVLPGRGEKKKPKTPPNEKNDSGEGAENLEGSRFGAKKR